MRFLFLCVCACLAVGVRAGADVTERIRLNAGVNAVYIEVTPDPNDCAVVFAACPAVKEVGCYVSDAYSATAQYDSEGREILQKPVSYLVWRRGDPVSSTLKILTGGGAYVIVTDAACELVLTGRPNPPRCYWMKASSDSDDLLNLEGVSAPTGTPVDITAYFGEGPAGANAGVYELSSDGSLRDVRGTSVRKSIEGGKAYLVTSASEGIWPGVIGLTGADSGLVFASNETARAGFTLQNMGTTNHNFRLTYGAGEGGGELPTILYQDVPGWTNLQARGALEFDLAPKESVSLAFAADRRSMTATGGGILTVEDTGESKMRVRLPVVVQPLAVTADNAAWPDGIYVGSLSLNFVTYGTNSTPSLAGGSVDGMLLYFRDGSKHRLLQRLCIGGVDADGRKIFCQDLEKGKARLADKNSKTLRRLSSVLLDPYNPKIEGRALSDGSVEFKWTVGATAPTNPMRHSWHPDHDGVRKLSDGSVVMAPSGDDLNNYLEATKPELFSISNTITLTGLPKESDLAVDETCSGRIAWRLSGLRSDYGGGGGKGRGDIICQGTYTLQRVGKTTELGE